MQLAAADDDDPVEAISRVQTINGVTVIKLAANIQERIGLTIAELKSSNFHGEFLAYGKAVSIQPLLNLHHRYLATLTERERATAKFKQAEQSIQRQHELYQSGVTAKRNLQDQQAQWQTDKSILDASQYQDQAIIDEALLTWGKILSSWALTARTEKLMPFITGDMSLVQVTVPSHFQTDDDLQSIAVGITGERDKAQIAELISVSPQTDPHIQGVSYFFKTRGNTIKTGMSVNAWLPEQGKQEAGVIIPHSAVFWSNGQASVYVKIDEETFSRRTIQHYSPTANGYFLREGLKSGDLIVTTGAQMLLSEEMHRQIPSEDND